MSLDTIHNYYEQLVFEHVQRNPELRGKNPDYVADIACMALNALAPRYIRHDVDMASYLSDVEHDKMEKQVADAVKNAMKKDKRQAERE